MYAIRSYYDPEHVHGSEDDAGGGEDAEPAQFAFISAHEDQELTDEPIGTRQADGGEGNDHENGVV